MQLNLNCNFGIFETSYSEFLILLYKSKYQLSSWKIQHCFREANAYADALARKEVFCQQDFYVFQTLPVELSHLLLHDLSGLFCNRLCFVTAHVAETKFLIYISILPSKYIYSHDKMHNYNRCKDRTSKQFYLLMIKHKQKNLFILCFVRISIENVIASAK